ncbi:inactive serine/threonine-protein kinase VRK3 [Colossoma macropomum]|uniref:inactive serine/threonine-protein kinase VRK3 n=1 Tax=Colossoma macropomum TaxID=42526 RepID=UPI00186569C0|nr:inactive serine/threonine-protein kinase VRK3 [Colossoma macropomum]
MLLHYCPQCGSKLQSGFKFCPSCGEKLPCLVNSAETADTETAVVSDPGPHGSLHSLSPGPHSVLSALNSSKDAVEASASSALTRSPIFRSTRQTATKITSSPATPPKAVKYTDQRALTSPRKRKTSPKVQEEEEKEPKKVSSLSAQTSPSDQKCLTSPRKRKASPKVQEEEELKIVPLPQAQTPPSAKSKAKRAKRLCVVEPVQEGVEFCDQSGKKWKLVKLLFQTEVELTYGVQQVSVGTSSDDWKHILRLGAKEGQLFNEQNFLQRAAKPVAVEKWMKKLSMDFLGIPSCVGFGLHDTYRFLIFPDMGQTLQSVMDIEKKCLPEKAVLQLALRLLDALEFVHENEYTHADIHAGNIYISTIGHSQVFLSGFGHAFRFCPGGNHVEYREGSRTPHQGNLNFISLDSHKGAGPSRRSDLQSLGYCLLSWMTGTLPWSDITKSSSAISAEKERYMTDVLGLMSSCFKKRRVSDVLQSYLSQAMGLHYTEKPDYSLLKAGLNEALQKMGGTLGAPLIFR